MGDPAAARSRGVVVAMLFVAVAAVLWGSIGTAFALLIDRYNAEPIAVVTLRAVMAAVTLGVWLAATNRPALVVRRADLPGLSLFCLVTVTFFYIVLIYTFEEVGVAAGTMLLYLAPALVTIGSVAIYRERVVARQVQALCLTLVGCALVVGILETGMQDAGWLGIGLGVFAAASYGSYSLFGKRWLSRYSALTVIAYDLIIGSAGLLVVKLITSPTDWPSLEGIVVIALFCGIVNTLLPLIFFTLGLRVLRSSQAATIATLEPVVAVILAATVLDEVLSWLQFAGVVVVVAGLLMLARGTGSAAEPAPA